jgi:hypothetical protein
LRLNLSLNERIDQDMLVDRKFAADPFARSAADRNALSTAGNH